MFSFGSRSSLRRFHAFTLIELIVVIIVIGILASLAAVSYGAVVDRSELSKNQVVQLSFVREVQALMAFGDLEWFEAVELAEDDLPEASSVGVFAADGMVLAPDLSLLSANPTPDDTVAADGEIRWAVDIDGFLVSAVAGGGFVRADVQSLEQWSSSVPATTLNAVSGGSPAGDGPSSTITTTSTSTTTTTSTTVPLAVPSAPSGVSASAVLNGLSVSWVASVDDGGSPVTSYTVSAEAAGRDTVSCSSAGLSCSLSGLVGGVSYTVSVVASNSVGDSVPSVSIVAVPVASVEFVGATAVQGHSTSTVINKPAGTQVGDMLVMFVNPPNYCRSRANTPSGWTLVESYNVGNAGCPLYGSVFSRRVVAGEAASYTVTVSEASPTLTLVAYRNVGSVVSSPSTPSSGLLLPPVSVSVPGTKYVSSVTGYNLYSTNPPPYVTPSTPGLTSVWAQGGTWFNHVFELQVDTPGVVSPSVSSVGSYPLAVGLTPLGS